MISNYLKFLFSFVTGAIALVLLMPLSSNAMDIPTPPTLAVKAYLLRDASSQQVVAQQAGNKRVEPASLTKVMTAYLSFKALRNGHLSLTQTLPISEYAWKAEGSRMFVEPNIPVTVDELLHGMIVQSGNDASIALAEGVGGSEQGFVELMNKQAAELGMKSTHYMNATGLPNPQHYTTAEDLSLLAMALIRDFPNDYKRLYAIKEYTYNKITQPNRNRLLWLDPFVDGMKTGHTETAGYCLISSAKRGETRFISVVLGAPTESARATESQKLLNYGFQFFEAKKVYSKQQNIKELPVWKGVDNQLIATVSQDVFINLPKGEYARVKVSMTSKQPLIAPVNAGQEVGKVQFNLDGKVIAEYPLVASKAVPVAGLIGRLWDSIKLLTQ